MAASHRPQWGWHQLTDNWARQIVADADIHSHELVLDIGAGFGALTAPLVATGARVIAIELHEKRLAALRSRFAGKNVTVVRADAADLRFPRRPFRVVANPPFAVTTLLLRRLLVPHSHLVTAHIVLERAAARKWEHGEIQGARRWFPYYQVRVERLIPRSAFIPRPQVDTAVLVIERRSKN